MTSHFLPEPELIFASSLHVCPRAGMKESGVYDLDQIRPDSIKIAVVGLGESVDKVLEWLRVASLPLAEKKSNQPTLFPPFPGFNAANTFFSRVVYDETYIRKITNTVFDQALTATTHNELLANLVNLYLTEIAFIAKNKRADVIICALPEKHIQVILSGEAEENAGVTAGADTPEGEAQSAGEDEVEKEPNEAEEEQEDEVEKNFRHLLKAKAMQYGIPLQLVRDRIGKPTREMQDPATIAWNFFTALYYKAGGTPWALSRRYLKPVCFAGISFYKSLDGKEVQTSIAQIFNEFGKGVILRGTPAVLDKDDRQPHLDAEAAYQLLLTSLTEYRQAMGITPSRLVLHKTSNFKPAEAAGFTRAATEFKIDNLDMVTLMPTDIKLMRKGQYPPLRGTCVELDARNYLLYTRGSIEYFRTYPGAYVPSPIQVRLFRNDENALTICEEVLALTKMNWNNTQFDRKWPVTIECARKVGDVMKYLPENVPPQIRYSHYM